MNISNWYKMLHNILSLLVSKIIPNLLILDPCVNL